MKIHLRPGIALVALVTLTLGWVEPAFAGGCAGFGETAAIAEVLPGEMKSGGESHAGHPAGASAEALTAAPGVSLGDSCPMVMSPGASCSVGVVVSCETSAHSDSPRRGAKPHANVDLLSSRDPTPQFRPPRN